MRAFVTGATGFVGGHLVDRLLAAGDDVVALVRSPDKAAALASRGVRLVVGDLANRAALREGAEGADVVYHAAALLGAPSEAQFVRGNRDGTASVLDVVSEQAPNARFVQVSSLAAAGPAERGRPRTSAQPDAPVTGYGRSKLAADDVVRESGLRWVIARPPAVYGPRDRDNFIKIYRLARVGVAPIFGDGKQELSLVCVPDLAEGLRLAGSATGIERGVFFLNHPEVVRSVDIVQTIGRQLGRAPRLIPLPRPLAVGALAVTDAMARFRHQPTLLRPDKVNDFFAPAWTADPAPFMQATGWSPQYNLRRGLELTFQWYREAGWL